MDPYMHIVGNVRAALHRFGLLAPRALCGTRLDTGLGAAPDAPLCPECFRRAGWTHDQRH